MIENELVVVTITGPTVEELTSIVRELVDARLAACGNIIPSITSVYRWNGNVVQEPEALALVHTRTDLLEAIKKIVTRLHPYDTPQIVGLASSSTTTAYSDWLRENTVTSKDSATTDIPTSPPA